MPKGKDELDYTEKLIPTRVTITRQRGEITYVFEIDGYRGEETGQIYYNGKDVLDVEHFLDRHDAILLEEFAKLGLVVNFTTPNTVISPGFNGTNRLIRTPLLFNETRNKSTRIEFSLAYRGT